MMFSISLFFRIGLISFVALLIFSVPLYAEVLFEDNFDNHADWSPPQPALGGQSIDESSGVYRLPDGYFGWRLSASPYNNKGENTMNIRGSNTDEVRGGAGKAFVFFSETVDDKTTWSTDGLLVVKLPDKTTPEYSGQPEIYVRYYVKFSPVFRWYNDVTDGWSDGQSPQQKMLHVSNYNPSRYANKYDFFSNTENKPRFFDTLSVWGGGSYRIQQSMLPSILPPGNEGSNVYFGPSPTDWGEAGMIGDGNWHCWEWHFKINSADGVADGIAQFWHDGALVYNRTDIPWVAGENPLNHGFNMVYLGGNSTNSFARNSEEKEQWYAVDDFVVSTTPIGSSYVIGNSTAVSPPQNVEAATAQ